ncbi:high mobility group protein 20A [Drosophila bipectinata]|uniref:high mobility group protein 20A n=1 Tax=Drosophila bipectinata TaxID=42026 RepID=UPI001C88FD2D|nr:SWI/SNF-related matrix-associated actin-dependent regulator of chromatin subfamily E member 1-related [Drosophila bipectinata]
MPEKAEESAAPAVDSPAIVPVSLQSQDSGALEDMDLEEKPVKGGKKSKKSRYSEEEMEFKKLAQRRINVAGAPKMPLNGYVRFMNDRREELRREQPHRTALEHTKIIGEEWQQLSEDRKMPYIEAAAKDKAIYQEQLQLFLKEHPEIVAKELAKAKKATKIEPTPKENSSATKGKKPKAKTTPVKRQSEDPDDIPLAQVKRTPTPQPTPVAPPVTTPAASSQPVPPAPVIAPRPLQPGEIPIYTNEFIEHNRSTENELRTLRKAKTDLEQQNAVLEQHVDNTKAGYAKVMAEVSELKEENVRLESYLNALRQKLVTSLVGVSIPSFEASGPNIENVDKYIRHLASLAGQPNNASLLKAREALRKLDTSSLLKH